MTRCRKTATFPSAARAQQEVEKCRAQYERGTLRRRECAVYPCVEHAGWHLTSRPREGVTT